MKISKKKILLGIPIILISLEIYLGIIFGYFVAKFFSGKQSGVQGKIKSFFLNIGNYRLHLHHWLLGLGTLISVTAFNLSLPFSRFSLGFFGGMVFQGIYCYSDWYQILIRRKRY
jgi:polyferredoxin